MLAKNWTITLRKRKNPLVMLTAYDAPTARLLEEHKVDMILIGDSVGCVLLGYPSTKQVTMDEMLHHARAVRRGVNHTPVIGDLPYEAISKGVGYAVHCAMRFKKEAGCDAVKLEWNKDAISITRAILKTGIPVMGHVGLTPQTTRWPQGLKVKGKTLQEAKKIFNASVVLEQLGAFAVVLECVPFRLAAQMTRQLKIPTFGIGAGPYCKGQVLVFNDLMGLQSFKARFVKRYAHLDVIQRKALSRFLKDVRQRKFPTLKNAFK
jgi:3-methyl-2-oxobutanoate hydroxymethyltransferase